MTGEFPSLKARQLLRVLGRLGYRVTRQDGSSHRWLVAPVARGDGRPRLLIAFHDRTTVGPGLVRQILVRQILVKQVGLSVEEALEVIHGD
ncbi:type II toxin-antitoxin system HicA family toxin [Candidatus Frankia alpina]|uniref:Type II toxin-antitoxin system HicA family toxin n=1 Tax=Candidatus Frankia alpina TaxID=2699483 RepID=A0A4S5CTI7_9ACTN|nr:type II toxin-antitoxin system HicA family toxin [Candidatus Frankia alpina]THJ49410.1 type II toxin-antitoxin system HicA family toxin [Candidatus Frankia alpina]